MKIALLTLALILSDDAVARQELRDLKSNPLNARETKAYKMATQFAQQFGPIRLACVNPDKPEQEPIMIQFTSVDANNNAYCEGPQYAISVELDMYNNATSISLTGDSTYTSYQTDDR